MGNRKVIAKNTLLLYFRMGVTMLVALVTSRIVLDSLGIEDYGLYNVIGGVVIMFTFLNGSLSSATLRFLNHGIGKSSSQRISMVYSSSVIIHIGISALVVILAETIGLWFVCYKLVIPPERYEVALWVYQLSILSCVASIMSTPFQAAIIAYEKMGVFAYISILEAFLKLGVALFIMNSTFDHLLFYAFLLMIVSIIVFFIKMAYCRNRLRDLVMQWHVRRSVILQIGSFSAWNLIGSLALMGVNQGTNMLLNMFYGPSVNAARAIAVQVQSAVSGFSRNFQTAATPQIMQSYASKDILYMHYLVGKCAKFSFFVLFIMSLPLMIEIKPLLGIWLKEVPSFTSEFVVLLMIISLIDSTTGPLITTVNATGKIRNYQLTVGVIVLMVVPISYVILKLFDISPVWVFIITLIVDIVAMGARLLFCKIQIGLDISQFMHDVYGRIFVVVILSLPLPFFFHYFVANGILKLVLVFIVSVITTISVIFFFGMTKGERGTVENYIKAKLHFYDRG